MFPWGSVPVPLVLTNEMTVNKSFFFLSGYQGAIWKCLSPVLVSPPYLSSLVFCLLAGERVLCFHGPLLYEAKVRRLALPLCVSLCENV